MFEIDLRDNVSIYMKYIIIKAYRIGWIVY